MVTGTPFVCYKLVATAASGEQLMITFGQLAVKYDNKEALVRYDNQFSVSSVQT